MSKKGYYESRIGWLEICYDQDFITSIQLVDRGSNDSIPSSVSDECFKQLNQYLDGDRKEFNLSLKPSGTLFQQKVWKELMKIPYGETASYKEIATRIGNPNASRAVGMANNKNPIMIVIPCHRVLGSNGKLVGYAGGLDVKEKLLKLEFENKS